MWPEIIPTIIVCALIALAAVLAIMSIVKDKKKGGGCSCGCSSCSLGGSCPSKKNADDKSPDDKEQ